MMLLWAVLVISIAIGLAERRRLLDRVDLLEIRVASAEAAVPRPAPPARHRPTREAPLGDAPPPHPERARTPSGAPPLESRRPEPRLVDEAAVEEAPFRLPAVNVPAVLGVFISLLGF